MNQPNSAALRHEPKQARGQRKVDHILRVAEALFAEAGFENVTTNAVAARAGISIGSLYQFFSGKEAILEAIADRYIQQTQVALAKIFGGSDQLELEPFMLTVIEQVVKQQEQRPFFLQCLATTRPSPTLAKKMDELIDEYAILLESRWRRRSVNATPVELRLRAQVATRAMTGLLPMAVQSRGRQRQMVIAEVHRMVVNYLSPMVKKRTTV